MIYNIYAHGIFCAHEPVLSYGLTFFSFQMNIPNILFTRTSGKMAVLSDKIIILVE